MIQFKVSAPCSLSLFGEYSTIFGKHGLTAAIDLRTTLTFNELLISNSIFQLDCPQINLLLNVPLDEFLKFYYNCIKDMESLYEHVQQFTYYSCVESKHTTIVQTFYYLLVNIAYKEQIEIKSFSVHISTELMLDDELACPASFMVCFAACLLNWSHIQKNINNTFNCFDVKKIQSYAKVCEEIYSEYESIHVIACTYGAIIKYWKEESIHSTILHEKPSMRILLVDSKQTQNLEAQEKKVIDLINLIPEFLEPVFNCLDTQTLAAYNAFRKLVDIDRNTELSLKMRREYILKQNRILKHSIQTNQNLLHLLRVSNDHLDDICEIALSYGFYGKYTDIGYGRYAFIWCPEHIDEPCQHAIPLLFELREYNFDVRETNLAHSGVIVEMIPSSED